MAITSYTTNLPTSSSLSPVVSKLVDYKMPSNVLEIFNIARYYFATNEVINSNVTKLATYPISKIIVQTGNKDVEKKVSNVLDELEIRKTLIDIGIAYFTYGNAFTGFLKAFKRKLHCPKCNTAYDIDDKKKNWKFESNKFKVNCKKCKGTFIANIEDTVQERALPKIIRWSIFEIIPEFNRYSNKTTYYKYLTDEEKTKIKEINVDFLRSCPKLLFEAYRKRRVVVLNAENQYHFKNYTLSDIWPSYGFPTLMPLFVILNYIGLLKKANEAIAKDYILPLRFLIPGEPLVKTGAPNITLNLRKWEKLVKSHIQKWRKDPLHIGFLPMPAETIYFSAQGKNMMTTEQIESLTDDLIGGMGMPAGFFRGVLNWSGQSVSLRMLENQFLNYREECERFLNNFILPKVKNIYNISEKIELSLEKFKMADDVMYKQLLLNLGQSGKVSDATLLAALDIDYEAEKEKLKSELYDRLQLQIIQNELRQQLEEAMMALAQTMEQNPQVDMDKTFDSWIGNMSKLQPLERQKLLMALKEKSPSAYQVFKARISALSKDQQEVKPLPEKLPPRRKESPI